MQDRDQRDQLADIGWDQMRLLLDKEMPLRRRGLIWWWLFPVFLAVAGGAAYAWYVTGSERESPIPPFQQQKKELMSRESFPQAHQEYEVIPSPAQRKAIDPSTSGSDTRTKSRAPEGVAANAPGSHSGNGLFIIKKAEPSLSIPVPFFPPSEVANQIEVKDPVWAASSDAEELAVIKSRLPYLLIPERKEEWKLTPTAPEFSNSTRKRWSFLGEASALTTISSQNFQTGAAAGVQVGRPVSEQFSVLSGLSFEGFSSTVKTPFSGTTTVVDVSQPTFGTPNRGSTVVDLAEEVPVRSRGIYLPLLAQVRLNRNWHLEGGGRVGYLIHHSLGASLAPEQLKESTPALAAAAESPFAGSKGQALDPALFRLFDTQWSLEAGRTVGENWIVYARYRQGIGNGVKVDQYEIRSKIIQMGIKYQFNR